jgi:hypothetical protein
MGLSLRKHLSAKGLFNTVYEQFKKIKEPRQLATRRQPIKLIDCLMSGLAVFSLKFPSLLKFDEQKNENKISHNLRTLFQVENTPSDTYVRERLDEVNPRELRKSYKKIFADAQRGGLLEEFKYLNNHYLLPGDGTGFFSSNEIHCANCCVKYSEKINLEWLQSRPDDFSTLKVNTYFLVNATQTQWELYYLDSEKNKTNIELSQIDGLDEVLLNRKLFKGYKQVEICQSVPEKLKEGVFYLYLVYEDNLQKIYAHSLYLEKPKELKACEIEALIEIKSDFFSKEGNLTKAKMRGSLHQALIEEILSICGCALLKISKEDKEKVANIITSMHRSKYPDQKVTYYHNMFCAAIVHPDKKTVLPFPPEPIMKSDGQEKNDCERNASKRLYRDIRREHPHLKLIVVEDRLASNVPHLSELKALNMRYIVGAKPGDHKALFERVQKTHCNEYQHETEDGTAHRYRYLNEVALNDSHPDFKVNFMEYWEMDKDGNTQHFTWVTDIRITNDNTYQIMRGGRSNWKIENETFNTLKNQNYHFQHNFGHGYQHLSTVFATLMMLAFFIDQIQEACCSLFKKARAKFRSRTSLWERLRGLFTNYLINSWEDLFNAIAHGHIDIALEPNTS